MKLKDGLDMFMFTEASPLTDMENNIIGCISAECGSLYCDNCAYVNCNANPKFHRADGTGCDGSDCGMEGV
jgi:hypothetical protein